MLKINCLKSKYSLVKIPQVNSQFFFDQCSTEPYIQHVSLLLTKSALKPFSQEKLLWLTHFWPLLMFDLIRWADLKKIIKLQVVMDTGSVSLASHWQFDHSNLKQSKIEQKFKKKSKKKIKVIDHILHMFYNVYSK